MDMQNELFKIGPVTIYGYGLMIAIGILLAYRLVVYRAEKRSYELSYIFSLTVVYCRKNKINFR